MNLPPIPSKQVVLSDTDRQLMHPKWIQWLLSVINTIQQMVGLLTTTTLTNQSSTVTAAVLGGSTLSTGLYRVTYTARITQAATTSSSLTIKFAWTAGGVACSQTAAAITGNTTSTVQTGTLLVAVDTNTSITYTLTYASVGGTVMKYMFAAMLESI